MIKLNRPDKPEILVENEADWLAKLKAAIATYGSYSSIPKDEKVRLISHYRHQDIKKELFNSSSQKCAFCESKPSESGNIEVEHFKPKSLYPDFTFDWYNFLPCCRKCNGNKLDHDTVNEPIINPYETDPEVAFEYHSIRIAPKKGELETVARRTIDICGLNGGRLMRPRADILVNLYGFSDAISEAIDDYHSADTQVKKSNRIRKINQALEHIELLTETNEKYSAFCRDFLNKNSAYLKAKIILEQVAA